MKHVRPVKHVHKRFALVPIGTIAPHPRNPRRGDVEAIKASIRRSRFYGAVLVQERHDDGTPSNTIIAGEHRWRAIRDLGSHIVPVCFVDVSDAEALVILLADNRIADRGAYDETRLVAAIEAARLSESGLDGTGYDEAFLRQLQRRLGLAAAAEAFEEPSTNELLALTMRWGTDTGQLWQIPGTAGVHRLAIGSSDDEATLGRLFPASTPDAAAIWTDPPYGVAYEGKAGRIENDDLGEAALQRLVARALQLAVGVTASSGPVFIAHPAGPLQTVFYAAAEHAELDVLCSLAWVKGGSVLGRSDHHYRHEPVLLCRTPADPAGQGDGSTSTVEPLLSVSTVAKPQKSELHPTMKPLALIEEHLEALTQPGDTVLDVFAGSGSTGIACERTSRVAALVELTPRYAAACLERFAQLGLEPQRLSPHRADG